MSDVPATTAAFDPAGNFCADPVSYVLTALTAAVPATVTDQVSAAAPADLTDPDEVHARLVDLADRLQDAAYLTGNDNDLACASQVVRDHARRLARCGGPCEHFTRAADAFHDAAIHLVDAVSQEPLGLWAAADTTNGTPQRLGDFDDDLDWDELCQRHEPSDMSGTAVTLTWDGTRLVVRYQRDGQLRRELTLRPLTEAQCHLRDRLIEIDGWDVEAASKVVDTDPALLEQALDIAETVRDMSQPWRRVDDPPVIPEIVAGLNALTPPSRARLDLDAVAALRPGWTGTWTDLLAALDTATQPV